MLLQTLIAEAQTVPHDLPVTEFFFFQHCCVALNILPFALVHSIFLEEVGDAGHKHFALASARIWSGLDGSNA